MSIPRVAVCTTTRADYGLLYWLIREIAADPELNLLLYVTGSHLSPTFGNTVREVEADGLGVSRRIEILEAHDGPTGASAAAGRAAAGFGEAFAQDRPALVVLLGDRFEIVPIAVAAVIHGVPVAHLHGGETSQGAVDEYFRHAVTKLASLHFTATETYRRRVLQMGESPATVHNLGAPGLDHLHRTPLLTRETLAGELGLTLDYPTLLVTYHPVTTEPGEAVRQIDAILTVIADLDSVQAVFTKANADPEGQAINARLTEFCAAQPERYRLFDNLGTHRYLSCLRHVSLMIGNSSSGLLEAPSFELPVVNVGARQHGRIRAANVIQVVCETVAIRRAVEKGLSAEFRNGLVGLQNPYDRFKDGRVSARIKDELKAFARAPVARRKTFVDLEWTLDEI